MHFDAMALLIVERVMLEGIQPESAPKLAVDAREQIEIEFGGHARGVIVGGVEHLHRLDQVDADNQLGAASEDVRGIAQESRCLMRLEIADGRTGEKPDAYRRVSGF